MPTTISPSVIASSTPPATSTFSGCSDFCFDGRLKWIITIAITASGTLTQNTDCQWWNSHTSAMPYIGPSTLPSSCAAPMPPSTPARLRAAHRSAASASVTGSSAPLAAPWMTRPMTRTVRSVDSAVMIEPIAKPARLTCSSILRPNRSDARPSSGIAAM